MTDGQTELTKTELHRYKNDDMPLIQRKYRVELKTT